MESIIDIMEQQARSPFDVELVGFLRQSLKDHMPTKPEEENCPTCYYGNMEWPCASWVELDNLTRQWLLDEYAHLQHPTEPTPS